MERRPFGRTGMEVTALGLGTAEIGYARAEAEAGRRLLAAALDAGLNVVDTAACYGNAEELIGEVAARRSEFFLFTKCGHAAGLPLPDWDPRMLEQSIERSLRRMRTDHLDLLQLHGCPEQLLRQGDVIAVLQRAKEAGHTRFIGYSGDGPAALHAIRCGAFDSLQTSVNIADQESIDLLLPEARARGMGVIAKRPIANAAWRTGRRPASPYHHTYWERLQALDYDFLRGDVAQGVAVALRFTLSTPGVCTAIVGTTNPGRWAENAALLAPGPLPPETYEAIRRRWREVAPADWHGQG
jgi:aryl-alcohol dehydrogenase-like predicted oxidoreductase